MPIGGVESCGVVPGSSPSLHGVVPRGVIVMWSGLLRNIPQGWALCDGTEGTPNLTARFVRNIATATTEPGATGGADSVTVTQNAHAHDLPIAMHTDNNVWIKNLYGTGASQSFTVGLSNLGSSTTKAVLKSQSVTATNQAHDNRPAYFELAYIMKL